MKFAQGVGKLFRNHAQENKFTQKILVKIIYTCQLGLVSDLRR